MNYMKQGENLSREFRMKHENIFIIFLLVLVFLFRNNPSFVYPHLLIVFAIFLVFNFIYNRYLKQKTVNSALSYSPVFINGILITVAIDYSGGVSSYLWVMYLLPVFTACLLYNWRGILLSTVYVIILQIWVYKDILVELDTVGGLQLISRVSLLALSASITAKLASSEKAAKASALIRSEELEKHLQDQQFYTRSLIESNIDAIMTTDTQGIITDVNKQMEVLTGCTRAELIGSQFKNYFTDPELAEECIKQVLVEGKVRNREITTLSREGRQTVVSCNATTFYDREMRLQGVFASVRDVTEGKLMEQALREKNIELESARVDAEKANLAKSDFLSSMSHELRSPLNAILGFAQLMESDSPEPTPIQKENIGQILQAGWHLLKLINQILDLAKIESGKLPLSPEAVSLAEVMDECYGMVEGQAQKRGIQMTFPNFDIPCYVHADRTRLKQIIINFISNAIKYNREQGTVEVTYSTRTPGRIRVIIKDTGSGLPMEKLKQLFQPFNRLDQEKNGEEGTGMGLVVARKLIELMGGVVGVESTVGVGSVFWFSLPTAAEPQFAAGSGEPKAPDQSSSQNEERMHVLLYVEDNPANLRMVEQLIARQPELKLLSAMTGKLGIELARTNQPEVILMDINLPDISGFEALRVLRNDPATAHIPVVAISANAMPHDVEKGLEAGFFRYLTKPINVNEFMETLDVALKFADNGVGRANKAGLIL